MLFTLNVINPPNAPHLSCNSGQISASGAMIYGVFEGDSVLVATCFGLGVPGAFIVYHDCYPCSTNPDYSGHGIGTATVSSSALLVGLVAAGVTSGVGTAGTLTVYTAEADAVTFGASKELKIVGGGAGGETIGPAGNRIPIYTPEWSVNRATIGSSCALATFGHVYPFGDFAGHAVSSNYTFTTCPPTSLGPQTAKEMWILGPNVTPIHSGAGDAVTLGASKEPQ